MKKKTKNIIIGIVSLIVLTLILNQYDLLPFAVTPTFTPIFCNDYEFTCCNEIKNPSNPVINSISDESYYQCPTTATKCSILSVQITGGVYNIGTLLGYGSVADWFVGSSNCRITRTTFNGDYYECDNDIQHKLVMLPGDILFVRSTVYPTGANVKAQTQIQVYDDRLDFTGRAGSTTGVPVSGADGCKFNPPGGKIYTSSILSNPTFTGSYTVPLGQCILSWQGQDRHICGYKEETCQTDSECGGYQYGNKVCNARTLQTYGCRSYGNYISTTYENGLLVKGDVVSTANAGGDVSDESKSTSNTFGKRCEVVQTQQVQCCGDTDCGTNYRCDTSTFTCKQSTQVECTNNYDCGVSIQCDAFAKKLKAPICSSGKCSFSEQTVECCSDQNCPFDSYCSVERKCEKKVAEKTICPNECCENDDRYFDRLCSDSKPFCVDGTCTSDYQENIKECESCDAFAKSKILSSIFPSTKCEEKKILGISIQNNTLCMLSFFKLLLVPIVFIISTLFGFNFFQRSKNFKIKNKGVNILVSLIISGILAYLIYISFIVGLIISIIYFVGVIILKTL